MANANEISEVRAAIPDVSVKDQRRAMRKYDVIQRGSVISSAFSMAKATLGAGALSLAGTFVKAGPVLGCVLLILMAYITVVSIQMITRAVNRTGLSTYEEVVDHLFGRVWAYLFEVVMILFCFGTCVAYLISICDIIMPVLEHYIPAPTAWYEHMLVRRDCFTAIVTLAIMLPLSLCRSIQSVRYVSFLGVMCVCFLGVTTAYILCRYGVSPTLLEGSIGEHLGPKSFGQTMAALSVYSFSYCCHNNVPQIYSELNDRSYEGMSKVAIRSVLISFSTYITIAICGYLAFGTETDSLITNMKGFVTGDASADLSPDPVVILSMSMMCFAVIGAFPLNVYPIRLSVEMFLDSLWGSEEETETDRTCCGMLSRGARGSLIVFLTVTITYFGTILIPNLSCVLELAGGLTASVISFIGPAAFNLALEKPGDRWALRHWKLYLLVVTGMICFLLGTWGAIMDAVEILGEK